MEKDASGDTADISILYIPIGIVATEKKSTNNFGHLLQIM